MPTPEKRIGPGGGPTHQETKQLRALDSATILPHPTDTIEPASLRHTPSTTCRHCQDCGADIGGHYGGYDTANLYYTIGNRTCRPCIARRAKTPLPPVTVRQT